MNNEGLLISGEDIPFPEAQLTIHQPRLKEVFMISEESFFIACQILTSAKELIMDNSYLKDKSDFEILMILLSAKEQKTNRNNVIMLLSLLFPEYKIEIMEDSIFFVGKDNNMTRINNLNFKVFTDILKSMFLLSEDDKSNKDYNPVDKRAANLAERFKKRKSYQDKAEMNKKVAVFSRYISILGIGLHLNINELKEYTVFQIKDQMQRFNKNNAWNIHLKAQLAGASDLDEVDNWTDDIHPSL